MPLEAGRTLLHYRCVAMIGEGGMGVVWKAIDTKLDREVAIKVLPEAFSRDAERLARFEREAKLLAALNHPNIAAIYGVEHVEELRFLVLELVTGESLDKTLGRGPLAVDEALRICEQIAAGLQAAHEQGILHRDLKPANIKRTLDGRVKVLDFGLAKALMPQGSSGDPAMSPTITTAGTIAGSILGTASYMSPEQARGKPLDRRTDVWSFGCVLFELLSGQRAFPGETISDVIARVIQTDPDGSLLPATVPPGIRRLLSRCLQKDPDRRMRDIGDARFEIQEAMAATTGAFSGIASFGVAPATMPATMAATVPRRSRAMAWVGIAVGFAAGAAAAASFAGRLFLAPKTQAFAATPVRLELALPSDAPLAAGSFINALALSPDGRLLVYVGNQNGTRRLILRDMSRFEGSPIPGTEGAEGPFFSPDGQWVGFHADGRLKKISVHGGPPQTILATVDFRGAAWGPDGTIAVSPGQQQIPIWRLPPDGGEARPLTMIDDAKGEWGHRFPQFLPGGKTVIFAAHEGGFNPEDASIYAVSLDTGQRKFLTHASDDIRYVPTGHLLFVQAGTLLAVPFDADRLEVTGPPRPVAEGIVVQKNTGATQLAISGDGTLVYASGAAIGGVSEFFWIAGGGRLERFPAEPALYRWPRLSPDGKRLAVQIIGANVQGIWIAETNSHDFTKLTDGDGPVWSPTGDRVYFTAPKDHSLRWKRSDGSGNEETILKDEHLESPTSISPDGKSVAFTIRDPKTNLDILVAPVDGKAPARPLLQTKAQEGGARFSPDGKQIAFVSDETGRFEVYLMQYPDSGGKWQISRSGGKDPIWSADGRRLYYRSGDNLEVVSIQTTPTFRSGSPEVILQDDYEGLLGSLDRANYDVAPDGRVLIIRYPEINAPHTQVHLILNFFEELKRRD